LWEMAKANLEKVHKKYKDFANKSRWEVKFQKGDEVWLNIKNFRLPKGLSHKFLGPYAGPFKVLEKITFWHLQVRTTEKSQSSPHISCFSSKAGRPRCLKA
jgi:hypothetical protein